MVCAYSGVEGSGAMSRSGWSRVRVAAHLLLVGGAHELQLGVLSGRVVVHGDVPGTLTNEIHS